MADLVVILDFLSRTLAVVLAIGGLLGFVFRRWVGALIDAHFKQRLDTRLEELKHELSTTLEEKKSALARELERDKARLAEDMRRESFKFDRNSTLYEAFNSEFGRVVSELYSLVIMDESEHSDEVDRRLWKSYREILRVRVLEMLARSHDNVSKQTSFIETDLRIQYPSCFRNS